MPIHVVRPVPPDRPNDGKFNLLAPEQNLRCQLHFPTTRMTHHRKLLFGLAAAGLCGALWLVFRSENMPREFTEIPGRPPPMVAAARPERNGKAPLPREEESPPPPIAPEERTEAESSTLNQVSRQERFNALVAKMRERREKAKSASIDVASPAAQFAAKDAAADNPGSPILDLGPGVQLPAIFLDETPGRTPQIQQAKENLARAFEEELNQALASIAPENEKELARAYHTARKRSDELYRALFGEAAFTNLGIRKATEAVRATP
jgi:phosphopantetheinyl transferase (holo-ACP synthase)